MEDPVFARRALLIGAGTYGDGFQNLPAVHNDLEMMKRALESRGYSVECNENESNASTLDNAIHSFCRASPPGCVNFIYFSGHGIFVNGEECLVPARVSRDDARTRPQQRVGTNLSLTTSACSASLTIFCLDACRDKGFAEKGGDNTEGWGSVKREQVEHRFVRLFGCSTGDYCLTSKMSDGREVSVFTQALVDVIAANTSALSLATLLECVTQRCVQLAESFNPRLPFQTPCVDLHGDLSNNSLHQVKIPIFEGVAARKVRKITAQSTSFDLSKLHCIVVTSEHGQRFENGDTLAKRVKEVIRLGRSKIWASFRACWHDKALVSGQVRSIPDAATAAGAISTRIFAVNDVFRSADSMADTVVALTQADLAFFDVSGFEPGIMLLIGVRAATRRGVTICSHGLGWHEGDALEVPFNLRDLQICSHTSSDETDDPVISRIIRRVESGFQLLASRPRYQDLPGYDALREWGPDAASSATLSWHEFVLMLCSYSRDQRQTWKYLRLGIEEHLQEYLPKAVMVRRLLDIASPRLVSQSLYEYVRRASACVMDWSGFSASAFVELGARLAVSPYGAVQIIRDDYLPGAKNALTGHSGSPEPVRLEQVDLMLNRFTPVRYQVPKDPNEVASTKFFQEVATAVVKRTPHDDIEPDYNIIYRIVVDAIQPVTTAHAQAHDELCRIADSLDDEEERERRGATIQLFQGSDSPQKADNEFAARERRIAAFFYLEHRLNAGRLPPEHPLHRLHSQLGNKVEAALYDSERDVDVALITTIRRLLGAS